MNFTPLTEEDLRSEKAKEFANIYRFADQICDLQNQTSKISYKDSVQITDAVSKSMSEFRKILIKNIINSVDSFKSKENEVSAFIKHIGARDSNNQDPYGISVFIQNAIQMIDDHLYFTKSENDMKYHVLAFGKLVDAFESGKMTIDEVNEHLWKYSKALYESNAFANGFTGNNIFPQPNRWNSF